MLGMVILSGIDSSLRMRLRYGDSSENRYLKLYDDGKSEAEYEASLSVTAIALSAPAV